MTTITFILLCSIILFLIILFEKFEMASDFFVFFKYPLTIAMLIASVIFLGIYKEESSNPKAIDVYRDKAELKLIYTINNYGGICDTVKVDSIVIWKHVEITIE